jgi:uncharacterized protein Yka (UPF0111/DUF47 family)
VRENLQVNKDIESLPSKNILEPKRSVKKTELKKQLEELQKEKERTFDELSQITQKYENTMDSIDQQILEKIREIRN